jgi:hypothetical protein
VGKLMQKPKWGKPIKRHDGRILIYSCHYAVIGNRRIGWLIVKAIGLCKLYECPDPVFHRRLKSAQCVVERLEKAIRRSKQFARLNSYWPVN